MEGEKEIKFTDALHKLNDKDVRSLIIGRRAVILYGGPVLTADYDLWINPDDRQTALEIFQDMGCELSHPPDTKKPIVTGFSGIKKFDLFFHRGIKNIKGITIEFDKCFENSELIEDPAEGIAFRVPSIDDLINMKQIREHNIKDEQDIEYLLKAKKIRKQKK